MHARLLVREVEKRALGALVRRDRSSDVDLEALCELVVDLDERAERVGRRPGVGERQAVRLGRVLGLNVPSDHVRLVVARTGDLERDTGRSGRLDLERRRGERVVLRQKVVRRLAEVLRFKPRVSAIQSLST